MRGAWSGFINQSKPIVILSVLALATLKVSKIKDVVIILNIICIVHLPPLVLTRSGYKG
jgi:hypothetical protein